MIHVTKSNYIQDLKLIIFNRLLYIYLLHQFKNRINNMKLEQLFWCIFCRILRHNWCKQRDVTRQKSKGDSHSNDFVSQQGIYNTAEDNAGYQELGQVSGPSHYDQLRT